ncbi:E3 ubiquitin-protein ligase NEURL3 isoform X2 [Protopterus annectens]|uniref:E3 ubiquitin-protein ligase NEURL3 isoform X2 n=1 Tax=Protopterus annectens TaxID=7888 RepID=UPI001CFBA210|nr:E3 ubiquitin-protein ligase NEURL3 isoform X2 [Protopterus annectens]
MGNYCCCTGKFNPANQKCHSCHSAPLAFHPVARGSAIKFASCGKQAQRGSGFCNGIVFISSAIKVMEKVVLKITDSVDRWEGELRLGFTSINPSDIDPLCLPQYACPDLVQQPRFWGGLLKREDMVSRGSVIEFWVNKKGSVCYRVDGSKTYNLCDGVPTKTHIWAFVDIYGRTRAIRLLGIFKNKKFYKFQSGNHCYKSINNRGLEMAAFPG